MSTAARQNLNMGLVASTSHFVPKTEWAELEAAREALERAVEDHASENARRSAAREEERRLHEHLKSVQGAQQAARRDAEKALKQSTLAALEVVAEKGEAWLAQIDAERTAALAECDELRAALEAAEVRAHRHDRVETWLKQAMSSSVPQAFGQVAA